MIFKKLFKTKKRFLLISLVIFALSYGGFKFFNKGEETTRYALAAVEKGTLIVSVSGSGQVTVADQVDIKSETSGEVIDVYIAKDQEIWSGQLLFKLDSAAAEKTVRDAAFALKDAQRNLTKAQADYEEMGPEAVEDLAEAYEDGYTVVSTAFFKLSDYMQDLKDALGTSDEELSYVDGYKLVLGKDSSFIQKFVTDYQAADTVFKKNFVAFRGIYKSDAPDVIYQLIQGTVETTEVIAQALESGRHMFDAMAMESYDHLTIASQIDKAQPIIESDVSAVYSTETSLKQAKTNIDDLVKNTPDNLEDAQLNLESLLNVLEQKEDALASAEEALANCSVYAPFSGVISEVSVEKGDDVSSGASLAVLITKQKIVEMSLNEVDAAKVASGQKATIIFDALPDLTVSGKVFDMDIVGTVSQGVASYGVKISLDTDENEIKAGMSATADIITAAKTDVLLVANGALKSQGSNYYVELVKTDNEAQTQKLLANVSGAVLAFLPTTQTVEIGLTNDLYTEVISGLEEGDLVVSSTVSSSSKTTAQSVSNNSVQSFQIMSGVSGPMR